MIVAPPPLVFAVKSTVLPVLKTSELKFKAVVPPLLVTLTTSWPLLIVSEPAWPALPSVVPAELPSRDSVAPPARVTG